MQTDAVKAKRKAQFERWYYANVDGNRLRAKNYYWADPEKSREANRQRLRRCYERNPAQFKDYATKRRGLRNSARGSHTAEEFEALKAAHGFRCYDCGEEKPLTRGHGVPITYPFGSVDSIENIIPQCTPCNSRQGNRVHRDFVWLATILEADYRTMQELEAIENSSDGDVNSLP